MGRTGRGGGRSSGRGGGRSFGGRSSSSSSRSGYSSSNSRRSGYSHSHRNSGGHHHSIHYAHGSRYGCFTIIAFIVLLCIFYSMVKVSTNTEKDVTKSTVIREPLPKGSVVETDYYTDDIGGWINNPTKLTVGMKNFYQKTGVQPYLYITDNLGGNIKPTSGEAEAWLNSIYDELFTDEAHTILIFFERNGDYSMWYLNGKQAKTVMDNEAMDILMDYVELYYYSDLTEDEMFSKAYDMAATRIMEITREPVPWYAYLFVLIAVIVIIIILFKIWKAKKAQKNIEDENTRAILEAPLEQIHNFPQE